MTNDGSIYNYNFTNSLSKAYGNNLKLKGNKYCMFSGDINQDNYITLFDVIPINNASANFINGYNVTTDLNGDKIVELSDILIAYNNSVNFVNVIRP